MRSVEKKGFCVLIGAGYENAILRERGENWLAEQVQKIIDLLFKADANIKEISIVFDHKLKKAAWFKNFVLCINLAVNEEEICLSLRNLRIMVYTAEEIGEISRELPDLRRKYIQGDEIAGERYFKLSELALRFAN